MSYMNDEKFAEFQKMSEHEKDKLSCDQAFTFYLADVAKKVNQ